MTKYRNELPQLGDRLFATDAGLETELVFQRGIDLPAFAAFDLLKDPAGTEVLRHYYTNFVHIARRHRMGLVLETPTWRANRDWGARIGYDADALARVNRLAVDLLVDIRDANDGPDLPIVVSGNIGPRGDGYVPGERMTGGVAEAYHRTQIRTFAGTAADMVCALTLNYVEEAVGIVRAAVAEGMPVAVSFTVETDGRLPTGESLGEAVEATDAATGGAASYYMINCAHPTHFAHVLTAEAPWLDRIGGVRANASCSSHAELDAATELDDGDPVALGWEYRELAARLPRLAVVGGCCGTDRRHVGAICAALAA